MSKIKAGNQEFTVEGACFECMHMGWFVSDSDKYGEQIERCDVCQVFSSDDAARAHAIHLAAQTLKSPRRRTGKRFKMLLWGLEVTAEQECPSFWIATPNPAWIRERVRVLRKMTGDMTTTLQIAYEMQEAGLIHCPTHGDDVEADNEYVRDNMDRDEFEKMLREAGCYGGLQHGIAHGWRVIEGKVA